MESVIFFESIMVNTPYDRIYRRLGYRRGLTKIDEIKMAEVDENIKKACNLVHLKGAARRVSLKNISAKEVMMDSGDCFESESLRAFLNGAGEILLFAATGGREIIEAIEADAKSGDLTRGIVLDASASEIVDIALDWIGSYMVRRLIREGKRLTRRRFSPGYGDLALENQKVIHQMLSLDKIGVELTESFMLVPEKSVTAIAGIL